MMLKRSVFITAAVALVILIAPIMVQSQETILTIVVEEWLQQQLEDVFEQFEETHPGVKIVPVVLGQDQMYFGRPASAEDDEVSQFVDSIRKQAQAADILPVATYSYDVHATRTGSYLDLTPLLNSDPEADLDDFYPVMLNSFRWDGAVWALPTTGSVEVIIYNQTAFDNARLPYPDETWTINDYIETGRALTQYDASGEITIPGFLGFDTRSLFRALLGHALVDDTTFPPEPAFVSPELVAILEAWGPYSQETTPNFENGPAFNFEDIPLTISSLWRLDNQIGSNSDAQMRAALLPGGTASVQVQGYAISAGTAYPELAYEFLQFLTRSPDVALFSFGDRPARRSILGLEPTSRTVFRPQRSEEIETILDQALESAFPASDLQFFDYTFGALGRMQDSDEPVETLLSEEQARLEDVLVAIEDYSQGYSVVVATPVPTPVLTSGEVALNFGLQPLFSPMPNRDEWMAAIEDFSAQDFEVGYINMVTDWRQLPERTEQQDCFYIGNNIVPGADLSMLLPIDPLLAADMTFDRADMVTGTLEQVSREGLVWGLPLSLKPDVMWYDADRFSQLGIPEPFNGWTVSDFERTLREIYAVTGKAPYQSRSFGGNYLLLMMAAYGGGSLVDQSSFPPVYHLLDPAGLEAAQQVLDLARDGLIDYQSIGGSFNVMSGNDALIYDQTFQVLDYQLQNRGDGYANSYRVVMFPEGRQSIPLSYELGVAYISQQSAYPDACYRWISYIAQHPELLDGMPVRRSQFEAASSAITNGEDVTALYEAFNEALQEPSAMVMSLSPIDFSGNPGASYTAYMSQLWLYQAFDAYVLENANLELEFEVAQTFIEEFQQCTASIPTPDQPLDLLDQEASLKYFDQFSDCAIAVDPDMEALLRPNR